MVIPSASASQRSTRVTISSTGIFAGRLAQVSTLMQPLQPIEQPCVHIPMRRPYPSDMIGKCKRERASFAVMTPLPPFQVDSGWPHGHGRDENLCPGLQVRLENKTGKRIYEASFDEVADSAPAVR